METSRQLRWIAAAFAAIFVLVLVLPPVAAEEDAEFAGVTLSASPKVQGIGGVVLLTVSANFYGGCCYSLHAYDVVPNITHPAGLEMLSGPSPPRMDKFEATQGGLLTSAYFYYSFKTLKEGKYAVNITISTRNCGAKTASIKIEYIKGAIISEPRLLFPATPTQDSRSVISVVIFSGLEGVTVKSAEIEYALLDPGTDTGALRADDGGVLQPGNVRGRAIVLSRDPENSTLWRVSVPPTGRAGQLAVWFAALDSTGNTTISPVTFFRVADTAGVYGAVGAVPFVVSGLMLLGILVIGIWHSRAARALEPQPGPSLAIPGQSRPFDEEEEAPRRSKALLAASAVGVAAALVVSLWAVSQGLLDLMRSMTGGL